MQDYSVNSPSWIYLVYWLIASFLTGGGIVAFINTWLNRKKPQADLEKTQAEVRRINVHADMEISQSVIRVTARLEEMQLRVDEILDERDKFKRSSDKKEIELQFADHQLRKMKALLDIHGIKYHEFDE